mgnify:CR=1 FL=1
MAPPFNKLSANGRGKASIHPRTVRAEPVEAGAPSETSPSTGSGRTAEVLDAVLIRRLSLPRQRFHNIVPVVELFVETLDGYALILAVRALIIR